MSHVDTTPYVAEKLLTEANRNRRVRGKETMEIGPFLEELPVLDSVEEGWLEKCASCYEKLLQISDAIKGNGNQVSQEDYDKLMGLREEHVARRSEFEESVLREGSFLNGDASGELGRAYMGRCHGGMRNQVGHLFLCPRSINLSYLSTLKIKQPESPQDI